MLGNERNETMETEVFFYERRKYGGDDETPVACGDCNWNGAGCDLNGISDYEERVAPGEVTPAGECPECGALAYLAKGIAPTGRAAKPRMATASPSSPVASSP
jgi:hypothetical protein